MESSKVFEERQGDFLFTTDRDKVDFDAVESFLHRTYWAKGMPRKLIERAIRNSLTVSVFRKDKQVAVGRLVTDYATFGYFTDIFVHEDCRGQGLAQKLVTFTLKHPELQGFRRWVLVTNDAQALYRKTGFKDLSHPDYYMEILGHKNVYTGEAK